MILRTQFLWHVGEGNFDYLDLIFEGRSLDFKDGNGSQEFYSHNGGHGYGDGNGHGGGDGSSGGDRMVDYPFPLIQYIF